MPAWFMGFQRVGLRLVIEQTEQSQHICKHIVPSQPNLRLLFLFYILSIVCSFYLIFYSDCKIIL